MSTSSRIPPLLQPHVNLPEDDSILLVTSTLGASANWLIVRFLCEAFGRDSATKSVQDGGATESEKEDVGVVLVSFMRDWDFWRSEARKGGGLDLERLKKGGKLAFVDGLTNMLITAPGEKGLQRAEAAPRTPVVPSQVPGRVPGRTPNILPARGPPGRPNPTTSSASTMAPETTRVAPASIPVEPQPQTVSSDFFIKTPEIQKVQQKVESAIRHLKSVNSQRRTLLVLDTPSFLLASNPDITASMLSTVILQLHALTSHVIVHLPADDALITLSTPAQPLEVHGHNFLVKTAHMSSRILSCRVLDTGFAKDVSGVLRITQNSTGIRLPLTEHVANAEESRGTELLYLCKGDGSVKMFERGAGGEV